MNDRCKRAASISRARPRKTRPRLLGLVLVASCVLTGAKASRGGRPLVVDDAAPVAVGLVEVEIGLSHTRLHGGGRQQAVPTLTTAYGVIDRLEIGLGIQRVNHDQGGDASVRGFEDLHLLTKFIVIEETEVLPTAAFSLDVSVPTANAAKGRSTGKSDQAFTFIMSKLYDLTGLHLNLGYLLVDSPRGAKLKNRLRGGIAAEYGIHPGTALLVEVFGSSRASKDQKNEAAFQLGARYALTPGLVIDAAAGRSLRSSGASVEGRLGLTWTIDIANYLKTGTDLRRTAPTSQRTNYSVGQGLCECCKLGVAFADGGKTVHMVDRQVDDNQIRNHVVRRSLDGGRTFAAPVVISNDGWQVPSCPHSGPSIGGDSHGKLHVTWFTLGRWEKEAGVYYSVSGDGGKTFAPRRLVHANTAPEILYTTLAVGDDDTVYLAWSNLDGDKRAQIFLRSLSADGRSWSAIQQVSHARGNASRPVLAFLKNRLNIAWTETDGEASKAIRRNARVTQ